MEIIISVIGGLGLLLYGMTLMGGALQKTVGNKMRNIIGALTKNKYMGALIGFLVTVVVGSSSATTVMTIGFVNSGIMTLNQAVGIIIGSNLGTTITAQLIAFNLDEIAPIIVGLSVAVIFISSDRKKMKSIGEMGLGFGLIFMGMTYMKHGLAPLQDMPWFSSLLLKLNNPVIGVLIGLGLTTMVQSSAASIGLLQALASQGLLSINQAFPILFGDNIGTTTTGLISSIGTNRNGKRAAMLHFLFNVIGTIIFMILLRIPIQYIVEMTSPDRVERQIANAHTLFNLINIMIQLPFSNFLVKAACFFIPDGKEDKTKYKSIYLDFRTLRTPSIALDAARKETMRMGKIVQENTKLARLCFFEKDNMKRELLFEKELLINDLEQEIVEYLVLLGNENLSKTQHDDIHVMMNMVNDLERIGDHAKNLAELSDYITENDLFFTDDATKDFDEIATKAEESLAYAMESFESRKIKLAYATIRSEDKVDNLEKEFRNEHINRLSVGSCVPAAGVVFLDALSNIERISDHAENIAIYLIELVENQHISQK